MSITDPQTKQYLREIAALKGDPRLTALEEYASRRFIPIIHKEAADCLLYFLRTQKAGRVLELGAAMWYSAIVMAGASPEITIDTIERDPGMIALARQNIKAFGLDDRITLHEGDILQVLDDLTGPYDFVFIDAGKSHYREYLEKILQLITPGAMIICDNILVRGLIAHEGVERKHSTIIMNMRQFIEEVSQDERFHSMVLPVGDGLLIIKCKE